VADRPLRVMADANVLIAGVLKPRWFFEFLGHALRGDFELVLAPQTVAEALRRAETKGGQRQAALAQHGIRVMLVGTFLSQALGWSGEALEAIRQREWSDLVPPP